MLRSDQGIRPDVICYSLTVLVPWFFFIKANPGAGFRQSDGNKCSYKDAQIVAAGRWSMGIMKWPVRVNWGDKGRARCGPSFPSKAAWDDGLADHGR